MNEESKQFLLELLYPVSVRLGDGYSEKVDGLRKILCRPGENGRGRKRVRDCQSG